MTIGTLIILAPLVIYLVNVLRIKPRFETPDDFFIAYRKVGSNPFANSSIAYGFQTVTVYPYLLYAVNKNIFVWLLNSIFWGLGIIFFSILIPKIKEFIGTNKTLHGFLGTIYGPKIRWLTSGLTITGILGAALGEVFWGTSILKPFIGENQKILFYFVMGFAIFYVLLYVSYGGQIASIITDQYQLFFSYIGVFGLIIYLLFNLFTKDLPLDSFSSLSLLFFIASIPLILWNRKCIFLSGETETDKNKSKHLSLFLNIVISMTLIAIWFLALFNISRIDISHISEIVTLEGFGYIGLASMIILPLLWQLVDMTNWQRILSVNPINTNPEATQKELQRGLRTYGYESPFTWISILALGIFLATVLPSACKGDVFIELPNYLINSHSLMDKIMGYLYVISILAIMLSTVDSIITASMFVFVYDLWKPSREVIDSENRFQITREMPKMLLSGRIFAIIIFPLLFMIFVGLDYSLKSQEFLGILLACYTAQLSFAPSVLGAILIRQGRLPKPLFVFLSILTGAMVGISMGLYSVFVNPSYQWYPIIASVICSSIIYLFGLLLRRQA